MHGAYGRAAALSKPASKRNAQTEACIKGSDEKIPSMRAPTDVKATAPALGAQSDRRFLVCMSSQHPPQKENIQVSSRLVFGLGLRDVRQ